MLDTTATVQSNVEIAPGFRLLSVEFNDYLPVEAGQFAMVRPTGIAEPLLRRALAVYRADKARLSFLYQVLGRGTQALSLLGPGNLLDVLVPLGNSWPVRAGLQGFNGGLSWPPRRAIVVAGGIGSASLYMLCECLRRARVSTEIFFGASSATAARGCGLEDFERLELQLTLTTDDGTAGEQGLITTPLERRLRASSGEETIYACGPWAMMRKVAEIADVDGLPCFVSLEAPMGCGFGVCVGCVVAVKREGPPGYKSYKRVCVDGSIFSAGVVRWEIDAMAY